MLQIINSHAQYVASHSKALPADGFKRKVVIFDSVYWVRVEYRILQKLSLKIQVKQCTDNSHMFNTFNCIELYTQIQK